MAIRFATHRDLNRILEIYAPYVRETAVSFEYVVPGIGEFTARFDAVTARFPWLVWEEKGQIFGYAYASAPFNRAAYQWCAESSVYLVPQAQGRGIGRKLYTALEESLRAQGYYKVYAIITSENQPSLAFHRAVGYTEVARLPRSGFKFGRWHGVVWMEKLLNSVECASNAPISMDALVKNDRNFHKVLAKMSLF